MCVDVLRTYMEKDQGDQNAYELLNLRALKL